jgi:hypothetical protein
MGEMKIACNSLVGKLEGKRQLVRPRCRWDDNTGIRIDLRGTGRKVWTGFIWLRFGTSGGLLWTR